MLEVKIDKPEPEHGWLPITIKYGKENIEIDVSDIPIEPIRLLIDALLDISNGRSKTIVWFLEPVECELSFNCS